MGANLTLAWFKKKLAAAVVQLDGSVFIRHMIDWFLTACCLYGARLKSEGRPYSELGATRQQPHAALRTTHYALLATTHTNNRPLKTSLSYAKLKPHHAPKNWLPLSAVRCRPTPNSTAGFLFGI
jgi:hypothetical protein